MPFFCCLIFNDKKTALRVKAETLTPAVKKIKVETNHISNALSIHYTIEQY